jgi:hypothetical protein
MNLIAAHLMALTQARYPHYQLITALLGGLSIVPAFQLARLFAPRSRCLWQALAAALMLLPMFAQNATFAWTKLTADFFVLAGVAFYVSGWQRGDPERLLTSFVCLAGGILTHYSAAPYALFLGLHAFVVVIPKRPARLRTVAALLLGLGLVLGPWLFWSTRVFGARSTFTSNSTWRDMSARTTLENVGKTVLNLRDTLIPQLLRGRPDEPIQAALSWGALRDAAFEAYQNNLPLSLGSLGAGLLVCDLLRRRRAAGVEPPGAAPSTRGRAPAAPGAFWLGFIVFSMVVGVASFGDRYGTGLAHITLQPVTLIGVVFLASQFAARPRALRWLAFTGLAVDAFLGVLLHVFLESIPLDTGEGAIRIPGLVMSDLVAGSGATNWSLKTEHQLQFFGDAIAPWAGLAWVAVAGLLTGAFLMLGRLAARGEPAESG